MRSKLLKGLIWLLPLFVGLAMGYGYSVYKFEKNYTLALTQGLNTINLIVNGMEFVEAEKQYLNKNRDVAIYALERALQRVTLNPKVAEYDVRHINFGTATIHARLGKLYQESGNKQLSENHLKNAVGDFDKVGWKLGIDEILPALSLLDKNREREAIQKFGKLVTNNSTEVELFNRKVEEHNHH
jgi:hypothetical protein